jgi:Domain of Unknown Function (DUF928)
MSWTKHFWSRKKLTIVLVCALIICGIFLSSEAAQAGLWDRFQLLFGIAPSSQPTGRSAGGAGRGPVCALKDNKKSVLALMPVVKTYSSSNIVSDDSEVTPSMEASEVRESVGGYTVEERPTFWFYLPYILSSKALSEASLNRPETSSKRVAQFVLLDDTNRPVWNELMNVELFDNPRLVEYPLPHKLEMGKLYNWYFSVICDSEKLSRNPVVRGWVQRVEPAPELQTDLRNTSRFDQYIAYANHGIWFETVNSMVKIRRQFPSTNRDAWISLLEYFQIPEANQPYVLESAEPTDREVVSGNQLPARM